MVTAMSAGPCRRAARQSAASTMSAVESGPPETARMSAGATPSPSNKILASAAETGAAAQDGAASAAHTLLFPLDALLHDERRARILASDSGERGAGRFLLA